MLVPQLVVFATPVDSTLVEWHVPFMLDLQSEVPIVFEACIKLVIVYVLHHDGMVGEQLKVVLWMEV